MNLSVPDTYVYYFISTQILLTLTLEGQRVKSA